VEEFEDLTFLLQAMSVRAAKIITETVKMIAADQSPKKVQDNETMAQAKLTMVRAHMSYLAIFIFYSELKDIQFKDKRITAILTDLGKVAALRSLISDCAHCYDSGFFAAGATQNMSKAFDNIVKKLRPQLIPLVESYDLPDFTLMSSIGNSFGDIYENQLDLAMDAPMNRTKDAIPSYF
jgi:hypothetical protein